MHNYCINPCQSLGYTRPSSHSSSFTNYLTSCFLDHRFHTTAPVSISPSCCCCCACCSNSCSSSIYRLPINPSLLYGLRQSTLIQYSPSRKLILNGRNRCFSRFSVSDFDRGCSYEKYGSFKERGGGRKGGRWGKGRYGRMVYEERGGGDSLGNVADEVEMMLSLLTEEVGEECFGGRERNGRSSWRVQVEDEKSEDSDGISFRGGKKNVGSVGFGSSSKRDSEYDAARYREEIKRQKEDRREEEREKISRCEDCRLKIEGSTSKSNQGHDIARYREEARCREETKRQKEDRREEGRENLSRIENHRERNERSTLKIDQEYDTTQYREEIKRREEDRRQEGTENLSKVENRRARKEESVWKSDQEYDTTRYRAEIKRQKEDRRQEGIKNISRIENRRVRKEGSTLKSDQEYDTTQYREEIKRQEEHRREEEIESLSRIENHRVRNEGSTLNIDQEYDTTRYREEIKRQKEDRKYEEKEDILRSENRKVRKEGSTFRIYREYDTAGYGEEIKRQKDDRREVEKDNLSRSENRRLRKEGSSCSSYYSVSSAGEFEGDSELQVKDDTFVGQSSIEYKRDQKRKEDIIYDGEVKEKVERLGDYVNEHESLLEKKMNAEKFYGESAGVEHDWRKKSENKVSEVMIEQAKSRKKQAEEHMRLSKIEQTGYVQRSDIQQQYIDKQEKSALAVNINVGMTVHHTLNDDRISEQSESQIKHKQFQEMSELHGSVVETASSSQKRYSGVERNERTSVSLVEETKGAFSDTAGHFARQDAHRWDSEQDAEVSNIEEIDKRGEYSSLSETRMHEDNTSMVLGLDDDREEKYERAGELVTRQAGSQEKSQQMLGISELEEIGTGSTSLSRTKANIRMKKQEEQSESVYVEAKVTDAQRISQKSTNRQEKYSTSVVEANITDTQQVSKTSTGRKEMSSTSVVEFVDDTIGRHSLTGKGELQIVPLKATRRPVKATSFNEGMPKEVSSSYKSLKLIPESSVQQIGVDDDDERSSQPPSEFSSESFRSRLSELQAREESSSAMGSDIYGGDRKDDSSEVHPDFISHEDALVSADSLQQSSTRFTGEFLDETRGRQHLTGKGELQIERLKATRRPLKASSFNEGMPKEVSSSYKSLKLIPESNVQQIGVDGNDKRSSRPSSEFSSASFRSGFSELQAQREESSSAVDSDIYGGDRKGDSHEVHSDFLSHEDALVSADRMQQSSTHFVGEFVDETRGRQSLTGKGEVQIEPLKATRRPLKASSFNEGMPKEVSSSYKALKLIPESSVQQIGMDDDDKRSSQSPSEFASASFRSGLSEIQAQREENSPATGSDIYGGEPLDLISHEDALGSADRLQSSTHFVGDFVEKIRQEVSTSESQKEKRTHETKLVQGKDEDTKKGVGQDGSGGSRGSSRGSGAKGPSDEIWHMTDQSIQGPPKIEAVPESPENTQTTTESGVIKRTGRSLWNVIGDIVRLRWASSRSEAHTTKSGGKHSPNQSTGSEAWFSGHEVDENNGENVKREDTIFPQEASSTDKQQSGSETHELSNPISSTDKIKHGGVDSSSFSSTEGGLPLRAGSLPSVEGTSSGSGIAEQSFPVPAIRMRKSPMLKDTSEASQTSASGSGKMVEMEQPVPIRLPAVPATEAMDGKLKRRTFQRSDHVLKDRFDEWEEAHTLETEQRKTDEMFMREALLEARKGADMWEVPVGAVLVQHGKIIARGYNLVEDLRDSTAHAEMICIREASNVLRTWRLSDTTLYVTLEPCPMCAGAILQSRVDTVVWGAPNKLLGADGSWIRLFPSGSGGNDSELGDNAAAGPVHPFHPNIVIRRGILSSECADVMQQFFQLRRKKKEKKTEQQPPTPPSGLPVSHHHPSKLLTKMHDVFHIMFCL